MHTDLHIYYSKEAMSMSADHLYPINTNRKFHPVIRYQIMHSWLVFFHIKCWSFPKVISHAHPHYFLSFIVSLNLQSRVSKTVNNLKVSLKAVSYLHSVLWWNVSTNWLLFCYNSSTTVVYHETTSQVGSSRKTVLYQETTFPASSNRDRVLYQETTSAGCS